MFGGTLYTRDAMYRSQGDFMLQMVTTMGHSLQPLSVLQPLVDQLFRPPPELSVDAARTEQRQPKAAGDAAKGSPPPLAGLSTHAAVLADLKRRAGSQGNAMRSLWVEALATVGPAPAALAALLSSSGGAGPSSPSVVVGPECAAALVTCCVMYFAALNRRLSSASPSCQAAQNEGAVVGAEGLLPHQPDAQHSLDLLSQCSEVYFLVPLDRAAPHLHLQGLFMEDFVTDVFGDDGVFFPSDRLGSTEVMLAGRAGRMVWELPMSGQLAHHQHHDPLARCGVRLLRLNLQLAVDTLTRQWAAVVASTAQRSDPEGRAAPPGAPSLVFNDAASGVAVLLKPSGMSSTLHASRPSLIYHVPVLHPWVGQAGGGAKYGAACAVSVFAQHGLLNRIDTETSGLVAVASTEAALVTSYARANAHKLFSKKYVALVKRIDPSDRTRSNDHLPFLLPDGQICAPVFASGSSFTQNMHHTQQKVAMAAAAGKSADNAAALTSYSVSSADARHSTPSDMRYAVTAYKVLEYFPSQGVYYVELSLRSGRRHQIRQHFAQVNHPLLGDVRYHHRAGHPGLKRFALHAAEMEMCVPTTGKKVVVSCEPPADFAAAVAQLRQCENEQRQRGVRKFDMYA